MTLQTILSIIFLNYLLDRNVAPDFFDGPYRVRFHRSRSTIARALDPKLYLHYGF